MMADFTDVDLPLPAESPARALSIPARLSPAPKAPICRKVRRLTPSQ